jgi:TetR/AcrR family transcriptional regulator, transcriptional repressor for nem operon
MSSKGDQTRQRIIEQSAPLFNRLGYAGTPISEIMRETGLEKGGIYNHFGSKDELALAALEYEIGLMEAAFQRYFTGKRHAVERLEAISDLFMALVKGELIPGGCPVMNTAIEADDAHPALKARAKEGMQQMIATIERVLQRGVEKGEIRASCDPQASANVIVGLLEGAVMMSKLYDNSQPMQHAQNHLKQYIELQLAAS